MTSALAPAGALSIDQLLGGLGTQRTMPPLRDNIAVGLYGVSGSGKSSEMNIGFQSALVVKTGPTVTRPYYSWVKAQDRVAYDRTRFDFVRAYSAWESQVGAELFDKYADQAGLAAVEKSTGWKALLPEFDLPAGQSVWGTLTQLKSNFELAYHYGYQLPVTGLVIDEFTEALRIIFNEMKPYYPPKKYTGTVFDDMPAMNAHEQWLRDFIAGFRSMGVFLGLVCQEAPLTYDDDKQSHFYGKIKYKCGPRTPFGRERSIITEAVDAMVRIVLDDGKGAGMMMMPLPPPPGAVPGAPPSPNAPPLPGAPVPVAGAAQGAPVVGSTVASITAPAATDARVTVYPASMAGATRSWPLPPKPMEGYTPRYLWTEATPEVEAKFRSVEIKHRENVGFREKLVRAGFISA